MVPVLPERTNPRRPRLRNPASLLADVPVFEREARVKYFVTFDDNSE